MFTRVKNERLEITIEMANACAPSSYGSTGKLNKEAYHEAVLKRSVFASCWP